jgi:hypothetical protein
MTERPGTLTLKLKFWAAFYTPILYIVPHEEGDFTLCATHGKSYNRSDLTGVKASG